jgi:hypothetical protein
VIITTGRIRRTLVNKINLLVNSPRSIEASHLALVKAESIFLSRASGCVGTSRGSSHGSSRRSSSTTPGLSSTTSPTPRVRVPRHVARLVTRLVAPLVVDYSRLVVDYFASAAHPGASARRAARHAARRAARRRLLHLRRASECLDTSRGSPLAVDYSVRHSSSTTPLRAGPSSTTPPRPGSSSTTLCAETSSRGHAGSTSSTPCAVTTCLAATLALLRVCRAPPRRHLPVASRRPFILTSFPN